LAAINPASQRRQGKAGLLEVGLEQPGRLEGAKMRDLVYKNLTSADGSRKRVATLEVSESNGLRSTVRRHFACVVREVKDASAQKPAPYLYVAKERNTSQPRESFFCRMKNSTLMVNKGRVYLILFMHSLKITLAGTPKKILPLS
jgi:hypothetical protein